MQKKELLILAPVMASHEQSEELLVMLSFLEPSYRFTILDPLMELSSLDNDYYYQNWHNKLSFLLTSYDAFIGFSFGGVILQQCFPLFERQGILNKSIILISAPSFVNRCLSERLEKVIEFAQKQKLAAAYQLLMTQVQYPTVPANIKISFKNVALACTRLSEGLMRVITTDSRAVLSTTSVTYYNFIGEQSFLVNQDHVFVAKNGKLFVVPNAGMRVLQDNVNFCNQKIGEILL